MTDPVLYLIMRNDIPSLNPGKLAAQAAHVANAFVYEFTKDKKAFSYLKNVYEDWKKQTYQGFGTTIVLGADKDFFYYLDNTPNLKGNAFIGKVSDPTYPCIIPKEIAEDLYNFQYTTKRIHFGEKNCYYLRNEEVGMYVFGDKEHIQEHIEGLELYP